MQDLRRVGCRMNAGLKFLPVSAQLTARMQRGALEVLCDLRELIRNQSEVLRQSIASTFQFYQPSPRTVLIGLSSAISFDLSLDMGESSMSFSLDVTGVHSIQHRTQRKHTRFHLFGFYAFGASEATCLIGVL